MKWLWQVLVSLCLITSQLAVASSAQQSSSVCSTCLRQIWLTGDVHKVFTPLSVSVQPTEGLPYFTDDYKAEITGKYLNATVSGLPNGRYTLMVYMAETDADSPGKRVMDIKCLGNPVIEHFDLYNAAKGNGRAYVVTKEIVHDDEKDGNRIQVTFEGKLGEAKFNAIRIVDAGGKTVAALVANDVFDNDPRLSTVPNVAEPAVYLNPDVPIDQRIDDLIKRMSMRERIGQLVNSAPAIERLHVPQYDYWNEALHGVARNGYATVFPQAIGLAATWDPDLIHQVSDTIATEARAKYKQAIKDDRHTVYCGLNFWSPNINIFRDPRWGRGQETYGEDPYLTSRIGVAFITGLQGNDPRHVKALACAKHYAVHSGPESKRHVFDVLPTDRDLYETYLPQFEAAVREGKVGAVMSAYNCVNHAPCSASDFLLKQILRDQWHFDGHVVSDCDAVKDIYSVQKRVATPEEAAAMALKAGVDLNCGNTYEALNGAWLQGLVSDVDIDQALHRVLSARFRLGLFDPPERVPYNRIDVSENDTPEHDQLALKVARESIVLLKNDGILPLDQTKMKKIAVIGPNADSIRMLVGNYNGEPSHPVSLLQGIKDAVGSIMHVDYAQGCPIGLQPGKVQSTEDPDLIAAMNLANTADVVLYIGGLTASYEGEEMPVSAEGFSGGDRTRIELPTVQSNLIKALHSTGKPLVIVNCSGSAIAMPWEAQHASAILQAWYPGQQGGAAVADVLFGKYNPSGKLPVTFYASTADLPEFENYSMQNRTYKYFNGTPLWPFGHGLSYSKIQYGPLEVAANLNSTTQATSAKITIENVGKIPTDEVVQLYAKEKHAGVDRPLKSLVAFKRVHLQPKEKAQVVFAVDARQLRKWDESAHKYVVADGEYELLAGSSSMDIRSKQTFIVASK